jgi:lysozyme
MRPLISDVSVWQTKIDFTQMKIQCPAVIIKTSEFKQDVLFSTFWPDAKAAGLVRGSYHFFRPAFNLQTQIDLASKALASDPGDFLALDFEVYDGVEPDRSSSLAETYCKTLHDRFNLPMEIYTRTNIVSRISANARAWMGQYGLWLAEYWWEGKKDFVQNFDSLEDQVETGTSIPAPPAPWKMVDVWQWTGHGRMPGTTGDIDISVFNGDLEAFYKRFGVAPAIAEPTIEDRLEVVEKDVRALKDWTKIPG